MSKQIQRGALPYFMNIAACCQRRCNPGAFTKPSRSQYSVSQGCHVARPDASARGGDRMATLTINGTNHAVDVPGDTPLLWVIREHLQMTGTKFGCGAGLCGA